MPWPYFVTIHSQRAVVPGHLSPYRDSVNPSTRPGPPLPKYSITSHQMPPLHGAPPLTTPMLGTRLLARGTLGGRPHPHHDNEYSLLWSIYILTGGTICLYHYRHHWPSMKYMKERRLSIILPFSPPRKNFSDMFLCVLAFSKIELLIYTKQAAIYSSKF